MRSWSLYAAQWVAYEIYGRLSEFVNGVIVIYSFAEELNNDFCINNKLGVHGYVLKRYFTICMLIRNLKSVHGET